MTFADKLKALLNTKHSTACKNLLWDHRVEIEAVVRAAEKIAKSYMTGMKDEEKYKGDGNYLADAIAALNKETT